MEFVRVSRPRAYREVIEQVLDAVISGDLRVGDRLPTEREVATQLGISRTSVREALRVLKDSGLVERRPGPGGGTTIVTDIVPTDLLSKAMELSHKRISDLLEVRSVLEPAVAELAAARANRDQVRSLEEIAQQARVLVTDKEHEGALFTTLDPRFHVTLARASQNDVLVNEIRSLNKQVAVAVEMVPLGEEMGSIAAESIAAIVEAVMRRNPVDARMEMYKHVSHLPPLVEDFFRVE